MRNKSFTYLLPLYCKYFIQENPELKEILFVQHTKNCYAYKKVNDKSYKLFTIQLIRPKERDENFQKYLSNLKKSAIFVEIEVTDEDMFLSFKIPEEIKDARSKFMQGKYSMIKSGDKRTILSFIKKHISIDFSTHVNNIFSKNKKMRKGLEEALDVTLPEDAELSSKPDLEEETINLEMYVQ